MWSLHLATYFEKERKNKRSNLLSVVCDLAILEVKLVHEGLAIKEVIERLISHFKQSRAQTK